MPLLHYGITFKTREEFEAAWPHLLSVASPGAPIVLKRGRSFWTGKSNGVCIHTPPMGTKPVSAKVSGKEKPIRLEKTIYIELIVDGKIVDLNRIPLPPDTPIKDERFKDRH